MTCMQPNVSALPVKPQYGDVFEINGITAVKLTDYIHLNAQHSFDSYAYLLNINLLAINVKAPRRASFLKNREQAYQYN